MKKIILIGAGGHALSVKDCIDESPNVEIAGFIDEFKTGEYMGYKILSSSLYSFKDREQYAYHITIGDVEVRDRWYRIIKELGLELVNVFSPYSLVSENTVIGKGNFVGKNVVIDSGVVIGDNNIINTGAIIEHGSVIGNSCNVSTVAILNGDVIAGDKVFVGSNAVCNGQIKIGDNATIGSGAVVTKNVDEHTTVVGIPAREVAL